MLDIKFLRNNPEIVKQNIKNKFQDEKLPLVDEVIELDKRNRDIKQEVEGLRADKNKEGINNEKYSDNRKWKLGCSTCNPSCKMWKQNKYMVFFRRRKRSRREDQKDHDDDPEHHRSFCSDRKK